MYNGSHWEAVREGAEQSRPSPPTTHPQVDLNPSLNIIRATLTVLKTAPNDSGLNWLVAWRLQPQPKVRLDNVNKELKAA